MLTAMTFMKIRSCIPQEAPWKGTNSSCLLNHENRMRTLFMAVSTEAAVLQSVLTANPGRNNRSENMKYGACSNDLHEKGPAYSKKHRGKD